MAEEVKTKNNQRDTKRTPYRALSIPERDTLFAYFEKHNGNMLAMTRDIDCPFKAHSQLRYYAKLYFFCERLDEIKRKRAEDVINSLKDSKVLAIKRAVELIETRQMPLRKKDGSAVLDAEGNAIFVTVQPDHKEVEAAWKIIKTELGEPTQIGKQDVTSKGEKVSSFVLSAEDEKRVEELFGKREPIEQKVEPLSEQPKENASNQSGNNETSANNSGGAKVSEGGEQGSAYEGNA